jgi:hypothetical protein
MRESRIILILVILVYLVESLVGFCPDRLDLDVDGMCLGLSDKDNFDDVYCQVGTPLQKFSTIQFNVWDEAGYNYFWVLKIIIF